MYRNGIIVKYYSETEERPFSRFTQNKDEIKKNVEWTERAMTWGKLNVDKYGNKINAKAY